MHLLKLLLAVATLLVIGACSSKQPVAVDADRRTAQRRSTHYQSPKGTFGQYTIKPGESIRLPDFAFKVYGIVYQYDWPEAVFAIGPSSTIAVSVGENAMEFLPMEPIRERRHFRGDYEGLVIRVKELGRDHVVVDIQPYDSVSNSVEGNSMTTYSLNIGDRLLVPGGYIAAYEVNHSQNTCRLWHVPDDGQQFGALNHEGRKVRLIEVPGLEFGLVHLTADGVSIEARLVE